MENLENIVNLYLESGKVVIRLRPDKAPFHCMRIRELCRDGFYNGASFHRVIDGFMAQGGCPLGNGTGSSSYRNLYSEFNDIHHGRGICSMARATDPHSANCQFFICFGDSGFLDGQYTVWGEVIEGMEHVDKIKRGNAQNNGLVANPDKILKMVVGTDENI